MIDYIRGVFLIVLLWTIDPILDGAEKLLNENVVGNILGNLKDFLSLLTTLIILVTALIKYKKEKKK